MSRLQTGQKLVCILQILNILEVTFIVLFIIFSFCQFLFTCLLIFVLNSRQRTFVVHNECILLVILSAVYNPRLGRSYIFFIKVVFILFSKCFFLMKICE